MKSASRQEFPAPQAPLATGTPNQRSILSSTAPLLFSETLETPLDHSSAIPQQSQLWWNNISDSTIADLDLPSLHTISFLIDLFYTYVHPTYPFLLPKPLFVQTINLHTEYVLLHAMFSISCRFISLITDKYEQSGDSFYEDAYHDFEYEDSEEKEQENGELSARRIYMFARSVPAYQRDPEYWLAQFHKHRCTLATAPATHAKALLLACISLVSSENPHANMKFPTPPPQPAQASTATASASGSRTAPAPQQYPSDVFVLMDEALQLIKQYKLTDLHAGAVDDSTRILQQASEGHPRMGASLKAACLRESIVRAAWELWKLRVMASILHNDPDTCPELYTDLRLPIANAMFDHSLLAHNGLEQGESYAAPFFWKDLEAEFMATAGRPTATPGASSASATPSIASSPSSSSNSTITSPYFYDSSVHILAVYVLQLAFKFQHQYSSFYEYTCTAYKAGLFGGPPQTYVYTPTVAINSAFSRVDMRIKHLYDLLPAVHGMTKKVPGESKAGGVVVDERTDGHALSPAYAMAHQALYSAAFYLHFDRSLSHMVFKGLGINTATFAAVAAAGSPTAQAAIDAAAASKLRDRRIHIQVLENPDVAKLVVTEGENSAREKLAQRQACSSSGICDLLAQASSSAASLASSMSSPTAVGTATTSSTRSSSLSSGSSGITVKSNNGVPLSEFDVRRSYTLCQWAAHCLFQLACSTNTVDSASGDKQQHCRFQIPSLKAAWAKLCPISTGIVTVQAMPVLASELVLQTMYHSRFIAGSKKTTLLPAPMPTPTRKKLKVSEKAAYVPPQALMNRVSVGIELTRDGVFELFKRKKVLAEAKPQVLAAGTRKRKRGRDGDATKIERVPQEAPQQDSAPAAEPSTRVEGQAAEEGSVSSSTATSDEPVAEPSPAAAASVPAAPFENAAQKSIDDDAKKTDKENQSSTAPGAQQSDKQDGKPNRRLSSGGNDEGDDAKASTTGKQEESADKSTSQTSLDGGRRDSSGAEPATTTANADQSPAARPGPPKSGNEPAKATATPTAAAGDHENDGDVSSLENASDEDGAAAKQSSDTSASGKAESESDDDEGPEEEGSSGICSSRLERVVVSGYAQCPYPDRATEAQVSDRERTSRRPNHATPVPASIPSTSPTASSTSSSPSSSSSSSGKTKKPSAPSKRSTSRSSQWRVNVGQYGSADDCVYKIGTLLKVGQVLSQVWRQSTDSTLGPRYSDGGAAALPPLPRARRSMMVEYYEIARAFAEKCQACVERNENFARQQ